MIKKIRNLKFVIRNCQKGMTHSMLTQCHPEYSRGMTYVEIIVVLSIFSVLSSVAMFNYGDFQDKVDIKNLASDIALQIVTAQKSALNGLLPQVGVFTEKPSYGVYFNTVTNNKEFIYFIDLNNAGGYGGGSEWLDTINITKNNYISRIDMYFGSTPIKIDNLPISITFTRPDSSAILYLGLMPFLGFDYVQITIKSPKETTAFIKIYPSGRVQVN